MFPSIPSRFRIGRAMCGFVLAAIATAADADALAAKPQNVLFIAADDLRNDLGCYGHPLVKTPHLDRLAADGMIFTHAYCQQALCNPSRASLMTGRRPDTLGIWNLPTHFRDVQPNIVTLPEWFKQHGYFTQNIGKIFHNWRQEIHGDPQSWSVPAELHYATHDSDTPRVSIEPLPPNLATAPRTECRDVPDEAYFDGRIAAKAVDALRNLKAKQQPFFLAVGFWKPHLPFNPPKRYWDLYDRSRIDLPPNPEPPVDVPEIALHNGRELLGNAGRILTEQDVRELRHGYLASISYLDAQVGRVLAELDRLQLTDSTVVVFWSDHGFHLGEHNLWCKTSNFELDARVPLIIAAPSAAAGTSHSLVELLDLYPTLVELCQLPSPAGLEGISLVPVLNDPTHEVKAGVYTQHPRPAYYQGNPSVMGVSVRTRPLRYTEWRDFESGEVVAAELYHHATDPRETRNLIAAPPDADDLQTARQLLEHVFPRRDRRLKPPR
jgi:iduronate 2-sulfatase